MDAVEVVPLVDEGLGNSAYLVELGDGRALAVDVSLDLRAASRVAARRGLTVAFAAETHLHADFLSGARQSRRPRARACWRPRRGSGSSPTPGCAMGTRSTSVACG